MFATINELAATILLRPAAQANIITHWHAHVHDDSCDEACLGLWLSIDLLGDGTDNDDVSPQQFIARAALPPSIVRLLEMQNIDRSEEMNEAMRESISFAWKWQGKPSAFIWHMTANWLDSSGPRFDVTLVDHNMNYTQTGSERMQNAFDLFFNKAGFGLALKFAKAMKEARLCWRIRGSSLPNGAFDSQLRSIVR